MNVCVHSHSGLGNQYTTINNYDFDGRKIDTSHSFINPTIKRKKKIPGRVKEYQEICKFAIQQLNLQVEWQYFVPKPKLDCNISSRFMHLKNLQVERKQSTKNNASVQHCATPLFFHPHLCMTMAAKNP